MQIEELVPFWAKLTKEEQEELKNRILVQNVKKGTIIHNGSEIYFRHHSRKQFFFWSFCNS